MTQSAPMNALWHPAIRADWLVLRRTGTVAFARIFAGPALLLTCCAAIACGDFYRGYGWCLAAGALLALGGSYAITRQRLLDALERWRFGWCGALPVARGATLCTLSFITLAALIAPLALVAALLLVVSVGAPHRGDLPYALAGIELALGVGTAVAAVRAFRRGALAVHHADGIREPLLALPWLNDPRLPHLLDWQRRAALVRWRRGGSFVMVGIVLAGAPMGAPMLEVAGLVLLVLSWSWLTVVMRAGAGASAAAVRVLGAEPLDTRRARTASLRYPMVATLCALVWMALGTALLRQGMLGLAWIAIAGAVSAGPLVRILRVTRGAEPSA
ncbi:MAG TPA: hypothetical protein VFI81_12710 [Rhodanobacteraceae bacterium]|nr:hypothetical protein [Rhodanobacteraceae bacterium]